MSRAVKEVLRRGQVGDDPTGSSVHHPDHRERTHGGRQTAQNTYDPDTAGHDDLESELYKHGGRVVHKDHYASGGKFIQKAIKHPGALHRQLGVPQGEKIPAKKLAAAAHSDNPTLRGRAVLAKTLKGFHK